MERFLFFALAFSAIFTFAMAKGGAPERWTAVVFLLGLTATAFFRAPFETRFWIVDLGMLLVDGAMCAALIVIALKAERFWPLWMSAFQIIQFLSHIPDMLIRHLLPESYLIMVTIWAYPMLLLLAIGTIRHQDRLRLNGNDRSWSNFSAR